ncbi:MAG: hypothetical protein ACQES2_00640 [Pseudomonadota bacterium]
MTYNHPALTPKLYREAVPHITLPTQHALEILLYGLGGVLESRNTTSCRRMAKELWPAYLMCQDTGDRTFLTWLHEALTALADQWERDRQPETEHHTHRGYI